MKKRSNWVLLAMASAGEAGLTPARLQKTLFLLQKAFPKAENLSYDFQPYHYGPFDAQIYQDAELLASAGLGEIHTRNGKWGTYHISKIGKAQAAVVQTEISSEIRTYLDSLVAWTQSLSFQELIASVYQRYPEYKTQSIFQER